MKKYNFSSIDKIRTPDEWKSKAINIPCTHIKHTDTKHFNFFRLAASLCLTIVCLVSVFLYTHMNKAFKPNSIISNKPFITIPSDFETTKEGKSTHNHTNTEMASDIKNNEPTLQNNIEPSEENETPNSTTTQTEEPTSSTNIPATIIETSSPTTPTQKETTTITQAPTQIPTKKPKNVVFNAFVKVENAWGVNDVDVYCKVFDANGNLLGSDDLFDWQHEVQFDREINNIEYYSYYASEKGLNFTQGYYTYVFYKRNGLVIYSGTQYVS